MSSVSRYERPYHVDYKSSCKAGLFRSEVTALMGLVPYLAARLLNQNHPGIG